MYIFCVLSKVLSNSLAAMQPTEGPPVEHVTVYGSASGSVRSASPNVQTTLANPMLTVQQTQATAFVQPTQQQSVSHAEPANQEPPSAVVEATPNSQVEWPSTSSVFGTGEFTCVCFKHVTIFFFFILTLWLNSCCSGGAYFVSSISNIK